MNKYERLKEELQNIGQGSMKAFGTSMMPIIKSGSLLNFEKREAYQLNDIVFCKVKGRYIDAHKIIAIDKNKGYLIANNHGFHNGWTRQVFGKAVAAAYGGEVKSL